MEMAGEVSLPLLWVIPSGGDPLVQSYFGMGPQLAGGVTDELE